MDKPVLGIETSCDETAAAVVAPDGRILAEAVLSQFQEHERFGGVVPEIAARAHLRYLPQQVAGVMVKAGLGYCDLGGVAATAGPGLIGGLIVGSQLAKGIALAADLPYVAVNHLEAHALTARLPGLAKGGADFPYLLLLMSGGHTQCVAVAGVGAHDRLGTTVDDAAGEAFDKVAKLLGLEWPGGPALERIARYGNPKAVPLPRPMLRRPGCDFSFSGLKTAVAQAVTEGIGPQRRADIAASFQQAVVDVLCDRAENAIGIMKARYPRARLMVVAGGVASNAAIRDGLAKAAARNGFRMAAPPPALCADNAVMVAWTGIERLRLGLRDGLDFAPAPALAAATVNYRHAFHAGNFADCFKHALLVALVDCLARKPAPFFVLDTHAGAGQYDLDNEPAQRTREADGGILRLLASRPAGLERYLGLVDAPGGYPGSPRLIAACLREADGLACCELLPEDTARLRRLFRHDRRVAVHERSGWEALGALLPPAQKRGLAFIDPPFEDPGEFLSLADGLRLACSRFRQGVAAAWYPIKQRAAVTAFHAAMKATGIPDIVAVELHLRDVAGADHRMNGCGMLVVNPPFGWAEQAVTLAEAVRKGLRADEPGAGTVLLRIADE